MGQTVTTNPSPCDVLAAGIQHCPDRETKKLTRLLRLASELIDRAYL